MARLSDMVDLFEAHRVDKRSTLDLFARRLREAGRLSKAKKGRGAAAMTYLDAARYLIAAFSVDQPEQAVDAEQAFSDCIVQPDPGFPGLRANQANPHSAVPHAIYEGNLPLDAAIALVLEYIGSGQFVMNAREGGINNDLLRDHVSIVFRRSTVAVDIRGGVVSCQYQSPVYRILDEPTGERNFDDRLADLEGRLSKVEEAIGRFKSGKDIHAVANWPLIMALAQLIPLKTSFSAGAANHAEPIA